MKTVWYHLSRVSVDDEWVSWTRAWFHEAKVMFLSWKCCDNEYSLALTADLVLFPACLIGRSGDFRTSKARFYDVVFWNSMKPNQI